VAAEGETCGTTSWRMALAPGERHDFYRFPGWWDLHEDHGGEDDLPRLRKALLWAFPPLPDGAAVLDVGAGTGTLLTLLVPHYPRLRYALLDPNPAALARAAAKLSAVAPEADVSLIAEAVDPADRAPLPGGPYRLVTSSLALHDIARPAEPGDEEGRQRHATLHRSLLRRVLGALEPGGHLIYADAMRPWFRAWEHLAALRDAGFVDVDCAYLLGRFAVFGGQAPVTPDRPAPDEG